MQLLTLTLLGVPFIVILDLLWLGVIAKDFYRAQLGSLMTDSIVWGAAILFYVLYAFGLALFVIQPNLALGMGKVVLMGAVFGFIAYAVYDLTNLATLKDWPLTMTIVDMIWGAFLTASVSGAVYYIATKVLS